VRERILRILQGDVSQVIKGLRQMATKRHLKGQKRVTVLGVAAYYYRNRSRMRYDDYLRHGSSPLTERDPGLLTESEPPGVMGE
jgi:hypothetical protein